MEFLSGATNSVAHRLIRQFAEHSPIACIRIEAVRRLGAVANDPATKTMIRMWAEKGFPLGANFQSEQWRHDEARIAAVTALGAVPKVDDADVKTLIAVVNETLMQPQNSWPLFAKAAASIKRIARATDVPQIVEILGRCPQSNRRLCLLAACSKYPKKILAPYESKLTKALCEAIQEWTDDAELTNALKGLGTKLAHTDLLKKLSERYPGDILTQGRGVLISTVMQAHNGSTEDLMAAALVFIRLPANAQRASLSVRQLAACVSAGHFDVICRRLLNENAEGYQVILENGSVLDIFGPISALVKGFCEYVGSITDLNRRAVSAMKCASSLLATQLSDSKDQFVVARLLELRQERRRHADHASIDNPLSKAASICRTAGADVDTFGTLADRVAGAMPDLGASEIIRQLIQSRNEIAELVIERVFSAAKHTDLSKPGGIAEESALRQFENLIVPQWRQDLGQLLLPLVVVDGKLNRVVLDFLRRNSISFVDAAKNVLASNVPLDDVDFVQESLACSSDGGAIEVLVQCSEHHEADRNRTNHFRLKAIELLGGAENGPSSEALSAIHARVCDTPSVRISAYRACGGISDLSSIRPLRERQKSETDAKAKQELASTLNLLKGRLVAGRPSSSDARAILPWISHVGELGDGTLLGELKMYLFPSHPSQDVVIAALEAIGQIGNRDGVTLILEYINDMAPPPAILAKARRVRMFLEQRNDSDLFESLARFLQEDSPALDPAINYESLLGLGAMRSATKVLRDCGSRLDVGHWDDFVTRMNGIFELMVRVVYARCNAAMGIDDIRRGKMLKGGEYAPLISCGEFKQTFNS